MVRRNYLLLQCGKFIDFLYIFFLIFGFAFGNSLLHNLKSLLIYCHLMLIFCF